MGWSDGSRILAVYPAQQGYSPITIPIDHNDFGLFLGILMTS